MTAIRIPRAGVEGGFAPLDSGLLVPPSYLPAASVSDPGACPQLSGGLLDCLRGDGEWSGPGSPQRGVFVSTDMWYVSNGVSPWHETNINSGARSVVLPGAEISEHPGVVRAACGSVAHGGWAWSLCYGTLILGGQEHTDIIFRIPSGGSSGTTIYAGLHDSLSVAEPDDGCYVSIVGTTLTGHCASNASRTATGTTYTISEETWYRLRIATAAALASAAFSLYTCADGVLVWSETVDSNLPVGRATSQCVVATNIGTTAKGLLAVDYISFAVNRVLVR